MYLIPSCHVISHVISHVTYNEFLDSSLLLGYHVLEPSDLLDVLWPGFSRLIPILSFLKPVQVKTRKVSISQLRLKGAVQTKMKPKLDGYSTTRGRNICLRWVHDLGHPDRPRGR